MKLRDKIILWVLVPLVVLVAVAGFFAWRYYVDYRRPNFSDRYVLYVYPEMNASDVVDTLIAKSVVICPKSVERCFDREDVASRIKPGRYVILPSHTSIYLARMLNMGWQTPQNLTLSGTIRTKGRLAKKISSQMMVDSASVASVLDDTSFLARYGFTPETVFALFLPDTYQMYWTATVEDIFDRMKKEYDIFWNEDRLSMAARQNLTPIQVSVLASIVSGETLKDFEYPRIAGVYLNRYRKKMKLQADPTVAFCFDYKLDRILKKHLKVDSPYNTYKYSGLPPAPINVPPKACLEAVLSPERHSYLYFCASPEFDGTHRFAASFSDHRKNAREFQRALTARLKAAQQP